MENEEHKPFISDRSKIPELTIVPLIMGVILGIVFGASSLYLALKVGMTVSASIPIAVLSITLFRGLSKVFGFRPATILENNVVQTAGSAGESLAFGVAVTMPAILILGYDMELFRIMFVSVLGGLLGILMMIPLRWTLIVKGHKELAYPEGTACAEVLIVGEKGGTSAITVFTGFGVGLIYKFLNVGAKLWVDVPEKMMTWYKGSYFATEVSPELLGVGYIIGTRVSLITAGGGVLSAFVLTPAIMLFGSSQKEPLYPATKLISEMHVMEIWKYYILYIGAGAVAAAGIISLVQSSPTIWRSLMAGLSGLKKSGVKSGTRRTEQDLPLQFVGMGILGIILAIWIAPSLHMNLLGAILIVVFGFLFVTVSSRITGEIGSSSNPISGMTVATLLITCLIFLAIGWIGAEYRLTALSIAAIVCIAASNGGTTSQDLKTGYLVGATPRAQQIAILVGALTSALVIGYVLLILNDASTIYSKVNYADVTLDSSMLSKKEYLHGPDAARDSNEYFAVHITEPRGSAPAGKYLVDSQGKLMYLVDPGINGTLKKRDDGTSVQKYEAPKARLMSLIIDGILTQKLPWSLVLLGAFLSIVLELCGISALPFAVGVYLPISSSAPIMFGGLTRWLVDATTSSKKKASSDSDTSPGVLLASGLIAGGSIAGIGIALTALDESIGAKMDMSAYFSGGDTFAYFVFGLMALLLFSVSKGYCLKEK